MTCDRLGGLGRFVMGEVSLVLRTWMVGVVVLTVSVCTTTAKVLEKKTQKGPVEAVVSVEPADPAIGDTVTLTLLVSAQRYRINHAELWSHVGAFLHPRFFDPRKDRSRGRTEVTQRYQLQLLQSGRQSIPQMMIEFVDRRDGAKPAPDHMDAYELLTERLAFNVRSVLPDDAKADLHPPLGVLPLNQTTQTPLWPWGIGVLVAIAVTGPFAWRAWTKSRRLARQRSAYEIAAGRLSRLQERPRTDAQQIGTFFVELSAIVRQYLEGRFELRAPELTTEEFLEQSSGSADLSGDHQTLLRQFLRGADLVKFAKVVPMASDIDQAVAAAERFLIETCQESFAVSKPQAGSPTGGGACA